MSKRDIQDLRQLLPQLQQGEILQAIREAKRQGRAVRPMIGEKTKPKD